MIDWPEIYQMIWTALWEGKSLAFHAIFSAAVANPWMFAIPGAAIVVGGRRALWRIAKFAVAPAFHRLLDD